MAHKNSFFVIGTVGLILTAILHMVMSLFILQEANHSVWVGIYPVFLAFLILGTVQIFKTKQNKVEPKK